VTPSSASSQRLPRGRSLCAASSVPHVYLLLRGRGRFLVPHDDPTYAQLQEIAGPLIRAKVRQMIGKSGHYGQDYSDLEQETWTRLWPRLRVYDRRRGQPHGFLGTVIDRILINLLRDRLAAKRDVRQVISLHQSARTEEGQAELGQTISQEEGDARQERSARSETETSALVQDVAEVIARLPEYQRQLAQQLQHHSLAEIARQRGVPRSTLQSQVRKLRVVFDRAGLREYL
jgi:RNA polymerase sigma-70 factor (ECF subfamily)